MFEHEIPRTVDQAKKARYWTWAGCPNGKPWNPRCCAYSVYPQGRGAISRQCAKLNGFGPEGLYCKQHAKRITT